MFFFQNNPTKKKLSNDEPNEKIIYLNLVPQKKPCSSSSFLPAFVGGNPRSLISAQDSDESTIRRACSLSDLSMGKGKLIK